MAKKLTKNQQVEVKTEVAKETATVVAPTEEQKSVEVPAKEDAVVVDGEEPKTEGAPEEPVEEPKTEEPEETEETEDEEGAGETPIITIDTEKKEDEVTVKPTETVSKKAQMVKIRMRTNHKCFIGGEWYYLNEGKCYNVPENVKRILDGAGLLAPL